MIVTIIDKLAEHAIQLLILRKQKRQDLLEQHVKPVFAGFEQVHDAYLESFVRYREIIQDEGDQDWIRTILAILDRDNLFTANSRSRVLRLSEAENDKSIGPFITGIRDYLLGARLVDPLGKQAFPNMVQRWRQGLSTTIAMIDEEHWQLVIDPDGAAPPLDQAGIKDELNRRLARYPMHEKSSDGLKRACALWALDEVVWEMQHQYDLVCGAYSRLLHSLSK